MTAIILASFYLHSVTVRSLVERDHYDSAVSQTLALAGRISGNNYFSDLDDLQQEIQLVAASRPDFQQIDVYEKRADGDHLIATTGQEVARLSALEAKASGGNRATLPDVNAREIISDGNAYWLITADIKGTQQSGAISVLVLRGARHGLVRNLLREYYLVLLATIAASVLMLYLLFVYFFRRPSRDIVQAMVRARKGQLSARAAFARDDELGDIAHGFNQLMDELAARDREREELLERISGFNDELLSRVKVATGELQFSNKALFEAQQRLAYSERLAAVGQVAAELAHEIGTPLNAISGHLQLLARSHPEIETQRRVNIINTQIAFIVQSVRSLLERTHRKPLSLRPVDLNASICESLRLVAPTLDSHRIKVSVNLDEELPRISADYDSLRQVFLNLVNNSIDAMPDGGQLEIATRTDRDAGVAEIIFRDSGMGIAPDAIEHIFEPMWTTKPSGSGLGLAIARQVMAEHGGRIECHSRLHQGTEFRLTLPLSKEAEAMRMEVKADAT
jgi:signal transduction histidine kinase